MGNTERYVEALEKVVDEADEVNTGYQEWLREAHDIIDAQDVCVEFQKLQSGRIDELTSKLDAAERDRQALCTDVKDLRRKLSEEEDKCEVCEHLGPCTYCGPIGETNENLRVELNAATKTIAEQAARLKAWDAVERILYGASQYPTLVNASKEIERAVEAVPPKPETPKPEMEEPDKE